MSDEERTGAEFRASGDLHLVRAVTLGDDADNVRIDATAKRVYVGYGAGAIASIDATTGRKIAEVAVGGRPESFQLEASGHRVFVNVPTARHISVIDRVQMKAIATWPLTAAGAALWRGCRTLPMSNRQLAAVCVPSIVLIGSEHLSAAGASPIE